MIQRRCFAYLLIFLLAMQFVKVNAQVIPVDTVFHPKRFVATAGIEAGLITTTLTGLYYIWYKDYPSSKLHSFNDNSEWLQVDKLGHSISAYTVGKYGFDLYRGCGVSKNKSLIFGGSIGFIYLTGVEIMDGYSSGWGFSWGDMAANAFGTSLFIGQQWAFNQQYVIMKFGYHPTNYAQYRPDLLGSGFMQRLLKDYNGHTYWLSGNIYSFLPQEFKFPKWINIAVGYGADGMLGGFSNPEGAEYPEFSRERQYYLSLDVDFTRIPVENLWLKSILNVLSYVKLPFPTLEIGSNGAKFHPIYF